MIADCGPDIQDLASHDWVTRDVDGMVVDRWCSRCHLRPLDLLSQRVVYPTDAPDYADQIAAIMRHYDAELDRDSLRKFQLLMETK